MPVKRTSQETKSDTVFGPIEMFRPGCTRPSTNDQQTFPMQLHALREHAACRG